LAAANEAVGNGFNALLEPVVDTDREDDENGNNQYGPVRLIVVHGDIR
jgi:hypothetical protein